MLSNNYPPIPSEMSNFINEIANTLNKDGQTIIFCGAGISLNSGIPIVNEFVPYVLLTLCSTKEEINTTEKLLENIPDNNERIKQLTQIIAEKFSTSSDIINKILNKLPFEAFIEALRDNCNIDEILDIYDAEKYEQPIKPNINHIVIAKLLAAGKIKTVVTTNFDQLIEKALEQQNLYVNKDYFVLYNDENFENIDWLHDCIRLIKIHGSIHDKTAIAITLKQIAQKKHSEKGLNIIRQIFQNGDHKQVIVLGYSCSDIFDITPQIESLNYSNIQINFVQHSSNYKIENICIQKDKNPFRSFKGSTRLFIDTDHFVQELWNATLTETYLYMPAVNSLPWKLKLQSWYSFIEKNNSKAIKNIILGRLLHDISEWQAALDQYEMLFLNSITEKDIKATTFAFGNMGLINSKLGNNIEATDLVEQSLKFSQHIGSLEGMIGAFINMGTIHKENGENSKAIEYFEKALKIATSIGDKRGECTAINNLGLTHRSLGDSRKAIQLFDQSLEIAHREGYMKIEANVLNNLGLTYSDLRQYLQATLFFMKCINIYRRLGDERGEGNAFNNGGTILMKIGAYQEAIESFEKCLEIVCRIGDKRSEGLALGNIGKAYALIGDNSKAEHFFSQSRAIFSELGLQNMTEKIDRMKKQ